MNVQQFLTATEGTDDQEVRRAMVLALALEAPHGPEGYRRFYRRVLSVLQAKDENPVDAGCAAAGVCLTTAA
mgnify:CR=1 FL=1